MSEFSKSRSRVRNVAATGLAVLSLSGALEGAPKAATSNAAVDQIVHVDETANKSPVVVEGHFPLKHGYVEVIKDRRAKTEGTPLNFATIKQISETATKIAETGPVFSVELSTDTDDLVMPVKMGLSKANGMHSVVIAANSDEVYALAGITPPAGNNAPGVTVGNADRPNDVYTFIAPVGDKYITGFGPEINADYFNLATQLCGSILDVELTSQAIENLKITLTKEKSNHSGMTLDLPQFEQVTRLLATSVACNGYALAAAAEHQGLGYEAYKAIAGKAKMTSFEAYGFHDVPYLELDKARYEELKSLPIA